MPLALFTKAVKTLGGKIPEHEGWLYRSYTTGQKREFKEARETERQKQYPNNEDQQARMASVPGKVVKNCPVCQGKKVESEHAKTLESAGVPKEEIPEAEKKIAEDHLKEDPEYYKKLKVMEAKKAMTAGSSSMTGSNMMHTAFDSAPEPNIKKLGKDQFSRNNLLHNFKTKLRDVIDPPAKPAKENWDRANKREELKKSSPQEEKEIKNLHLNSKLSPGLPDLKEVKEVLKENVSKEWILNLQEMLESEREFTGTFHKPVIDKENDIIPAKAMDGAMDDFMILPTLQEVHTERTVGIITRAWKTGDDEYKFTGKIKPGDDCNDVWQKVKNGTYDGLSIGGRRIKYSADCSIPSSIRTTPCVTHKLKLYNVSVCSSPVNPEATVDSVSKSDDELVFDITETLIKAESAEINKGGTMAEEEIEGVSKSDEELITKSDIAELTKAVENLTKSFGHYFDSLTTAQPQHIGGKGHSVEDTMQKAEDINENDDVEELRKSLDAVISERDAYLETLNERISKMEEQKIVKGGSAVIIPDQLSPGDSLTNLSILNGLGRTAK